MRVPSTLPMQDGEDWDLDLEERPLPLPSPDVREYVQELDLKEIFNHLLACRGSIQPKRLLNILQSLPTDSPAEDLETRIDALPETSYHFLSDRTAEFNVYYETCQFLKEKADHRNRPFQAPPPPYAPNHCRMEFARHVLKVGEVLLDGEPGSLTLSVLSPYAPLRDDVPSAILHKDEHDYRLVLTAQPS